MSHGSKIKVCETGGWVFKSEKYSLCSENVLNNLKVFWQDGTLCDVELISGDTVVKAHRVILAAACVYFKTMFESSFEERDKKIVSLPSIPSHVLPSIVEFIYTGQTVICGSTVQHLVGAADMLQIEELSAGCIEYLRKQLHPSNVLGVIGLAETYNLVPLAEEALKYALRNGIAVAEGEEFLDAPFAILIKLLTSDNLTIHDEVQVLHAALRWLDHDPTSRKQYCMEVMQQVRLRKVSSQAFENALATVRDPAIAKTLDVFKVVLSAVKSEPRSYAQSCFYVFGGCKYTNSAEVFDTAVKFDGKIWERIASMNVPRHSFGAVALDGLIYAVGGRSYDGGITNGEVYNPKTDTWTCIAPMQRPRYNFGLVAVGDKLYAFGGEGESSIEVYDTVTDEWSIVGEMPEPRSGMSAVTYDGAVYIVGGRTPKRYYSNDVLRYAPQRAEWQCLRPLLCRYTYGHVSDTSAAVDGLIFGAAAVVNGPNLYIVGGLAADKRIKCYNLQMQESYIVTKMSVTRGQCVAGVVNDVLIVAGGNGDSVQMYDLTKGKWIAGVPLPEFRDSACAVVL